MESVGGQGIGVRFPHASKECMERIQQAGYLAFVWGCESEKEVREAMRDGAGRDRLRFSAGGEGGV